MADKERLTWKRDLDGHADVGLRDGVTVGEAICKLADYEDLDTVYAKHGEWEYGKWERGHWIEGNERCRCSVCHRDFPVDNQNIWNGCPHCLARMTVG